MNMEASFVDEGSYDIVNQVHKVVFPLGLMSVSCRETIRFQALCCQLIYHCHVIKLGA